LETGKSKLETGKWKFENRKAKLENRKAKLENRNWKFENRNSKKGRTEGITALSLGERVDRSRRFLQPGRAG